MIYKKLIALLSIFVIVLFSGCNSPVYNQAEANIADVKLRAEAARQVSNNAVKPLPPLLISPGLYVDKTPISLCRRPSWLKNQIILRGDQLPFSYYSRTVATGGGRKVLTHYQAELDQNTLISINYSGTVKGALDLIAAKTGYVYTVRGDHVYWQAFVTKTFDVAFMPGAQDYLMGKAENGGTKTAVSSNSAGGTSGMTTVSGFIDDSSASEYSSLRGKLSLWDDLRNTIGQMLSKEGKVLVSEATTTVTVRDKPTNVALIAQYVRNLNRNLSKQVLIKVQIMEVELNSHFSFGINWDVLQHAFSHSNYVLNADYGTPITISPLIASGAVTPSLGLKAVPGLATGQSVIQSLVVALSEQGKVSVVSEPRVVCLNNQVSVIRIVTQRGYLASLQTTNFGGGTGSSTAGTASTSVTTQLTPGSVVFGITLYVLPKILGTKVFMQVNADLSNFVRLENISSTAGVIPTSSNDNTTPIIQVPTMTQKQFNQRSMLHSGETLILSGFRQLQNQANAAQLLKSQDLGGKGALQSNTETIVLLTPIILPGCPC